MGAALACVPPTRVQKHLFSLPRRPVAGGPVLGGKVWAREQLGDPLALGPACLAPSLLPSTLLFARCPPLLSVLSSFTASSCPCVCWALGG